MAKFVKGDVVVVPYKIGKIKQEKLRGLIDKLIEIIRA
jgi:hypothetical protein